MSVCLLALVIFQILVFSVLSEDLNIFNSSALTQYKSNVNLLKSLFKLLLPLYLVLLPPVRSRNAEAHLTVLLAIIGGQPLPLRGARLSQSAKTELLRGVPAPVHGCTVPLDYSVRISASRLRCEPRARQPLTDLLLRGRILTGLHRLLLGEEAMFGILVGRLRPPETGPPRLAVRLQPATARRARHR